MIMKRITFLSFEKTPDPKYNPIATTIASPNPNTNPICITKNFVSITCFGVLHKISSLKPNLLNSTCRTRTPAAFAFWKSFSANEEASIAWKRRKPKSHFYLIVTLLLPKCVVGVFFYLSCYS